MDSRTLGIVLAVSCWPAEGALAWGATGHEWVSGIAIEQLPADVPAFVHAPEALPPADHPRRTLILIDAELILIVAAHTASRCWRRAFPRPGRSPGGSPFRQTAANLVGEFWGVDRASPWLGQFVSPGRKAERAKS
jgi:hypothetical protein